MGSRQMMDRFRGAASNEKADEKELERAAGDFFFFSWKVQLDRMSERFVGLQVCSLSYKFPPIATTT